MVVLSFSLMAYMVAKGSKPSGTGQVEGSNLTALISDNGNSFFQGQILKYFMTNLPLSKPYVFFYKRWTNRKHEMLPWSWNYTLSNRRILPALIFMVHLLSLPKKIYGCQCCWRQNISRNLYFLKLYCVSSYASLGNTFACINKNTARLPRLTKIWYGVIIRQFLFAYRHGKQKRKQDWDFFNGNFVLFGKFLS